MEWSEKGSEGKPLDLGGQVESAPALTQKTLFFKLNNKLINKQMFYSPEFSFYKPVIHTPSCLTVDLINNAIHRVCNCPESLALGVTC